jgi:hypothetical protein
MVEGGGLRIEDLWVMNGGLRFRGLGLEFGVWVLGFRV